MSVNVSHSTFAAAIAAAAHINTLRSHRYVLWKYDADAESWVRITHHPSAGLLRTMALPEFAYLISEEYVDIHGTRYDAGGTVLGALPLKGMLREAHPHVKWVNPDAGDPFPWLFVSDVDGANCVAPFGISAGWVSRVITVESGLPPTEEEEEDDSDNEDDGLMEE
jgi:hypothetical protein